MRPVAVALTLAAMLACASAAAAPVEYQIDPAHTYPSLQMPHMGVSFWRGKFNRTSGRIVLDRVARSGEVEIQSETASIDFGHDEMNAHAVTADWLDAARHPLLRYTGTLRFEGDRPVAVDGALTLRGVTRPLTLAIGHFACIEHPKHKREVCGADASGELERADFGMAQYSANGMGRIRLQIQVEALRVDPETR